MTVLNDGLAMFRAEVERRGGFLERPTGRETILDVTDPTGSVRRVKLKTKAKGDWQARKSDAIQRPRNKQIDAWVLLDIRRPARDAVVVDAEWMRKDMEDQLHAWLAADPTRDAAENNHHKITDQRVAQWRGRWDLLALDKSAESGHTVSESNLGAWLLTCNPKHYNLPQEIDDGETHVGSWSVVDNYRSRMFEPGQRALLWMAGPENGAAPRGIWGIGYIDGELSATDGMRGRYWSDDAKAAAVRWYVNTDIEILDPDERIHVEELRSVPGLADIEIIRQPQTSNPSWVTKEELALIESAFLEWPEAQDDPGVPVVVGPGGAGFGDAVQNRIVEAAAMNAATQHYEDQFDATVRDVHKQNLGYDLTALIDEDKEWHVEVKGVSGSKPTVLLTRNEIRAAREDSFWELIVVTRALSENPQVTIYDAQYVLDRADAYVYVAEL